jgi:AhpD family alkylhydroperoxidase
MSMARLSTVPASEWRADLRDLAGGDTASPTEQGIMRVFAHNPDLAKGVLSFGMSLYQSTHLPRRLVELVRLRVAFHNQCRSCMAIRYTEAVADGVTEDLVCSLERPAEADDLTDAERAALRFADLFATNHLAIDDAVYDDLRQYFTEGELVEIGLNCAIDVGIGRLTATWDVTDDLDDAFRVPYDERATPWKTAAPIIVP